jgi:S-DNA-T family DNA segregation ATPase FtsK/SpoIIIE
VIAAEADARAPRELQVYGVDGTGRRGLDAVRRLAHCGAVVGVHEHERVLRLLRRLVEELARRRASGVYVPQIVVAVDGLAALRATIAELEPVDGLVSLDRLLADGPALGVTMVATFDATAATSVLQRFAERWVFHLDDPGDGPAVGVAAARVPPAIPGRIVVVPSGLAAHVAALVPVPGTDDVGGPAPIDTLPAIVPRGSLDPVPPCPAGATRWTAMPVGRRFDDLATAVLHVPDGEHVLVLGPAGSGRTNALALIVAAWSDRHPTGRVIHDVQLLDDRTDAVDGVARHADRVLLVLDDAEHVTDPTDALARALEVRRRGLTVVAAGRGDALRAGYGTWVAHVRRCRLGFVMAAGAAADGDVLGAVLPRRSPIAPRPGLAWMVDGNNAALVQLAMQPGCQLGSMPYA